MPAQHRDNKRTQETVYRVFRIPPTVYKAMRKRRTELKMTIAQFLNDAIAHELPKIVSEAESLGLPGQPTEKWQAVRWPLTEELLALLRTASDQVGIPTSRLIVAAVQRANQRRRRYSAKKKP